MTTKTNIIVLTVQLFRNCGLTLTQNINSIKKLYYFATIHMIKIDRFNKKYNHF